jgi:thiol:disulfide interchange protein
MKSNIKKLSIFTIAILLMSSCGSISISQKRYSNGLNIDWFAGKDKKAESPKVAKKTKKNNQVAVLETIANEDVQTQSNEFVSAALPTESVEIDLSQSNTKGQVKQHRSKVKEGANKTQEKVGVSKLSAIKSLNKIKKSGIAKTDDNVNYLYLIMSFFPILCLIAVYLYEGQEYTTNFWVDLILHLTVLGAIVFAILVVLGMVSL